MKAPVNTIEFGSNRISVRAKVEVEIKFEYSPNEPYLEDPKECAESIDAWVNRAIENHIDNYSFDNNFDRAKDPIYTTKVVPDSFHFQYAPIQLTVGAIRYELKEKNEILFAVALKNDFQLKMTPTDRLFVEFNSTEELITIIRKIGILVEINIQYPTDIASGKVSVK